MHERARSQTGPFQDEQTGATGDSGLSHPAPPQHTRVEAHHGEAHPGNEDWQVHHRGRTGSPDRAWLITSRIFQIWRQSLSCRSRSGGSEW